MTGPGGIAFSAGGAVGGVCGKDWPFGAGFTVIGEVAEVSAADGPGGVG